MAILKNIILPSEYIILIKIDNLLIEYDTLPPLPSHCRIYGIHYLLY